MKTTRNSLAELTCREAAVIEKVGGDRRFRRRLLEMGLTPGTRITVLDSTTLGDPIEIEVRHSRMSIRRREAEMIEVRR